jgi:hypothetical protein
MECHTHSWDGKKQNSIFNKWLDECILWATLLYLKSWLRPSNCPKSGLRNRSKLWR